MRLIGKDWKLEIIQDEHAQSPREDDNLGRMVCWHNRYNLGDKHDYKTPSDFRRYVTEKNSLILPLYLYDHSGLTMRTTPFSCIWDSGQVGYVFVPKDAIKKEFGVTRITKQVKVRVEVILIGEVAIYDQYLNGDVWGYQLTQNGEETDSCWGFYGSHPAENGMTENLPENVRRDIMNGNYEEVNQ